ncbi:hypothetical protein GCM10018785_48450 [Streptomyces longispororuber]|uniref:Uncharacterized protein n=1 Tax=Streptomyces longispororuber TaxID=68230 RepID=A0A918ZYG2_9ACTN|nr:hypothetical protein GCM10018785_48450 [Streptomyces longispororuber]
MVRGRAAVAVDRRGPRRAAGPRARSPARTLLLRHLGLLRLRRLLGLRRLLLRDLLLPGLLVRGLLLHLLMRGLLLHLLMRGLLVHLLVRSLLVLLVLRGLVLLLSLVLRLRGPARGLLVARRGMPGGLLRRGVLRLLLRARRGHGGGSGPSAGQREARAVGGVAQVDHRAGADLDLVDPLPLQEGAVGRAVVLDDPAPAAPTDRRVPPGDPGVVERDVTLRIASEGVCPGRIKRPGPAIQFQYEFRHSMPH